jgi:hypothetical protein
MNTYQLKSRQRGFFDLGLGLALLAIFGTTTSVIIGNRVPDADELTSIQQEIQVGAYCHQTGGRFLPTPHPSHTLCCYTEKCLHVDSDRGVSEIILSYKKE